MPGFMDTESKLERILALESAKVSVIELREHQDYGARLSYGKHEMCVVIVGCPRNC